MKFRMSILVAALAFFYAGNAALAQSSGSSGRNDPYGASQGGRSGQGGPYGTPRDMGTQAPQDTGTTKGTRRTRDVGQELQQNPALSSKLEGLLPSGTNVQDAASGFKNLREFGETVHVAHNLNISFEQLKTKVTGGASLEQAIKDLKPGADAKAEVKKAKDEAKEDIKSSRS